MAIATDLPGRLTFRWYPRNDHTVTLTWPTDLTGRAFEVRIEGEEALDVTVDGDTATFTVPAIDSRRMTQEWSFVETTDDPDVTLLGGKIIWELGYDDSAGTEAYTVIISEDETITVTVGLGEEILLETAERIAADTALDARLDDVETTLPLKADLVGGFVPDAQIPSGITRDAELSSAVSAAVSALVAGAPGALDTLNELAAALGDDADFAATVTTALAGKQPIGTSVLKAGDTMTGDLVVPDDVYDAAAWNALMEVPTKNAIRDKIESLASVYASQSSLLGSGVGRFIRKMQLGQDVHIVGFGDSVMEGQTVTNPATDGFLILLAADLGARFGVNVTVNNRADSGNTVARGAFGNRWSTGFDDSPPPDLIIIMYGKNDIGADGQWPTVLVPGYPLAYSIAGLERLIQYAHEHVPGADILCMSENPYDPIGATANSALVAYNTALEGLAAYYGCEFVDGYTPFTLIPGGFTAYMGPGPDNTHPGTLGHRLFADVALPHFPLDYAGPAVYPGKPAGGGLLLPSRVDTSQHELGYQFHNITGTYSGVYTDGSVFTSEASWTNTGPGWGASIHPYETSNPTDYASGFFIGTEFFLNLNTTAAKALVAEVFIDGVSVYSGSFTLGKQLSSGWVMVWANINAPGLHTWKIVLTSGTLTLDRIGYLVNATAPPFTPAHAYQDITGTVSTVAVDSGGAATTLIANVSVTLPSGWTSMNVEVFGNVQLSTTEAFGGTNNRTIQINMRVAGNGYWTRSKTMDKDTANGAKDIISIADVVPALTATTTFKLDATSTGATKTGWSVTGWALRCIKHRVS